MPALLASDFRKALGAPWIGWRCEGKINTWAGSTEHYAWVLPAASHVQCWERFEVRMSGCWKKPYTDVLTNPKQICLGHVWGFNVNHEPLQFTHRTCSWHSTSMNSFVMGTGCLQKLVKYASPMWIPAELSNQELSACLMALQKSWLWLVCVLFFTAWKLGYFPFHTILNFQSFKY